MKVLRFITSIFLIKIQYQGISTVIVSFSEATSSLLGSLRSQPIVSPPHNSISMLSGDTQHLPLSHVELSHTRMYHWKGHRYSVSQRHFTVAILQTQTEQPCSHHSFLSQLRSLFFSHSHTLQLCTASSQEWQVQLYCTDILSLASQSGSHNTVFHIYLGICLGTCTIAGFSSTGFLLSAAINLYKKEQHWDTSQSKCVSQPGTARWGTDTRNSRSSLSQRQHAFLNRQPTPTVSLWRPRGSVEYFIASTQSLGLPRVAFLLYLHQDINNAQPDYTRSHNRILSRYHTCLNNVPGI